MNESFSLKIRRIFNSPLNQKPLWFQYLFPLFFLFSYFIFLIAKNRRKKSYVAQNFENIKIICVGNVLMGGTGKSPLVQKIAQEYLEKGGFVAIASRGISHNKNTIYMNPMELDKIKFLSDENREHFELLKFKNLSQKLFIFQDTKRIQSLNYFKEQLNKIGVKENAVFILDDGLQHFACPRNINLCVWQPEYLFSSPPYPFPIGPYREGFGQKSFEKLLTLFDFRVWSRTKNQNLSIFLQQIMSCKEKYHIPSDQKDIVLNYELSLLNVEVKRNDFVLSPVEKLSSLCLQTVGLVTGIAQPDVFINDMKSLLPQTQNWNSLKLDDHASYTKFVHKINLFLQNHFFRWIEEEDFQKSLEGKVIFVCRIELTFYDIMGNKINLLEKF